MKKKIALLQGGFNSEVMKYVMRGIRKRAEEEGADLYVFSCYGGGDEDPLYNQGEYHIFSLINCEDYDGFIMASNNITSSSERERLRKMLYESGKPTVSMEHLLEGLHSVGCENYQTTREMTQHMIQKHGCKKIFFIGGPVDNYESKQRMKGTKDAIIAAGLPYEEAWFRNYRYTYHDGYQAFYDFQEARLGLPDCVIAANDEMAVGYCAAAREQGLYAPKDFRIGGFDNSRFSETYQPRLTTVDREKEGAGYKSCDILFRLIQGEKVPDLVTLNTEVIYRGSCGCEDDEKRKIMVHRHLVEMILAQNHSQNNVQRLHKSLVQCKNWEEYAEALAAYIPENINCSAMYMLLNRQEYFQPYSEKSTRNIEFDSNMTVIFAWENGRIVRHKELFDIRKLVPGKHEDEKSHTYLILPIHFQEKEIGYCVIKDSFMMIDNEILFKWTHSINMSMEIMLERLALKHTNAVLDALSTEDAMTGVYNRIGLTRHAEKMLQFDRMEKKDTLILFSDINHLKMINDTYGHKNGDTAIITVAEALKKVCPKNSVVVRYGGDEFVMIVPGSNLHEGEQLKQQICEELRKSNEKLDLPYTISTSVGCVCAHPNENLSLEEYVKKADKTMYEEKRKSRL